MTLAVAPQSRPRLSSAQAAVIGERIYGLEATARELTSERDQNFELREASGRAFVLKVANGDERPEILELQNAALSHLTRSRSELNVPRICPDRRGETIIPWEEGQARHWVRLLTYVPGTPMAQVRPHTPQLLRSVGRYLAALDGALLDFNHPAMHRFLHWDIRHAPRMIEEHLSHVDPGRRSLVQDLLGRSRMRLEPLLPSLRRSVIHNDANDHNVLVRVGLWSQEVVTIVDYGDMVHTYTASDCAVAAAYAMLDKEDPLAAAAAVVGGYHEGLPLDEAELEALFPFVCLRLCLSVTLAAYQKRLEPGNRYLTVSERPAWRLLERLASVPPQWPHYLFRQACHLEPCPRTAAVVGWLRAHGRQLGPVVEADLDGAAVLDLSVASSDPFVPVQPSDPGQPAGPDKSRAGSLAVGRYGEARHIPAGRAEERPGEQATVHLGMDLFVPSGSLILAPLNGMVHRRDVGGGILLLHHRPPDGPEFYTLYGGLRASSVSAAEGTTVRRGERIAEVGEASAQPPRPPHLHFQLFVDLMDEVTGLPGQARPSDRAVWQSLCPDPNLILRLPSRVLAPGELSPETILSLRREQIGPSLSVAYRRPLHIVRGYMQYLYDADGRSYLDAINNVAHVGHCHPAVVRAGQRQMALLNTNTRYLHEHLVRYAERLCATLPEPLRVCFFVCTGSEANELAVRLARAHTGRSEFLVLEGAYHGNTSTLIDLSPYKFEGPGGSGAPSHVHKLPLPDVYRGRYRADDAQAGLRYAQDVAQVVDRLRQQDRLPAALLAESLPSVAGQIILPDGYLEAAHRHVRQAGGLCMADEVQVGLGRVGSHFWGFQLYGVVPDIVTIGKPMGNGHPLAAVVTTPEVARSFANGMEYFNTFGGNPVSCAIGLAVLDVIEEEGLQENAHAVGTQLLVDLRELTERHRLIGDVRGRGLFLGVELVLDPDSREPAPEHTAYVAERMKERGILIGTDGIFHNVLKIRPPLVFSARDAELLVATLDEVLAETALLVEDSSPH